MPSALTLGSSSEPGLDCASASSASSARSGSGTGEAFLHRKLNEVLETIDTALGAASLFPRSDSEAEVPPLKLFLAVGAGRVLGGAVVTTHIEEGKARSVVEGGGEGAMQGARMDKEAASLCLSSSALSSAQTPPLGIHRIYVLPSLRRCGLGLRLLDAAVEHSLYGVGAKQLRESLKMREGEGEIQEVPLLAFSQPTESGERLARAWLRAQGEGQRLVVFEE